MALDKSKTDPVLGKLVHEHLVKLGMETPMIYNGLSDSEKISILQSNFKNIMETLGLDLRNDSLIDTPKRVAKMYIKETLWGLDYDNFPAMTIVDNTMGYDNMLVEEDITISSRCEHHLVDFNGLAYVGYFPNSTNKVLGLSKIHRLCEFFSRRPQIQERLVNQIGRAMQFILKSDDVAVSIKAKHLCVSSRGIQDQTSSTITSFLEGSFRNNPSVKNEFMAYIKK
jgi:GTP cyclohydrolase I